MAAMTATITFTVSLAWWVMPYVRTVALLCQMLDVEPNIDRVGYWLGQGIKVKLTGRNHA